MSNVSALQEFGKLIPEAENFDSHRPQLHFGLRISLMFSEKILPSIQKIPVSITTVHHNGSCGLMLVALDSGHAVQVVARAHDSYASIYIGHSHQFSSPAGVPSDTCLSAFFIEEELDEYCGSSIAHLKGAILLDFPGSNYKVSAREKFAASVG